MSYSYAQILLFRPTGRRGPSGRAVPRPCNCFAASAMSPEWKAFVTCRRCAHFPTAVSSAANAMISQRQLHQSERYRISNISTNHSIHHSGNISQFVKEIRNTNKTTATFMFDVPTLPSNLPLRLYLSLSLSDLLCARKTPMLSKSIARSLSVVPLRHLVSRRARGAAASWPRHTTPFRRRSEGGTKSRIYKYERNRKCNDHKTAK
jgi:hypothetical protein